MYFMRIRRVEFQKAFFDAGFYLSGTCIWKAVAGSGRSPISGNMSLCSLAGRSPETQLVCRPQANYYLGI